MNVGVFPRVLSLHQEPVSATRRNKEVPSQAGTEAEFRGNSRAAQQAMPHAEGSDKLQRQDTSTRLRLFAQPFCEFSSAERFIGDEVLLAHAEADQHSTEMLRGQP